MSEMTDSKKDHRQIGQELDLFVTSDLVGSGLPLFTPRGTILRDGLIAYSEELQRNAGYEKVWIPHIAKEELYKSSGHWDKFGGELFKVESQETDDKFILKPMNCPHHIQIYASRPRSYRDLPVRYYETTTVYRDEKSGEIGGGISRVRSVTQDDAHVFCTMEQVEEELNVIVKMVKDMYKALGMEFRLRLSFRDPKNTKAYLGTNEQWQESQEIMEKVAKASGLEYKVAEGEAAFYAPKIDIMVIDAEGREWQTATEQLDFVQPVRFGITYVSADGSQKTPIMIHKALLGSIERFLSVYIEHTQGNFPLWLAPCQVAILPISEKHFAHARKIRNALVEKGIRAVVDLDNQTLGAKIRGHTLQKIPYMSIIGDKEAADAGSATSVRTLEGRDLGTIPLSEFVNRLAIEIEKKA